jgi:neurofibromin 1
VSSSEEVRSRCHVKHTIPRWQTEVCNEQPQESANGTQNNVRRQKSFDMLDQTAIAYARQQQHKAQHQVKVDMKIVH